MEKFKRFDRHPNAKYNMEVNHRHETKKLSTQKRKVKKYTHEELESEMDTYFKNGGTITQLEPVPEYDGPEQVNQNSTIKTIVTKSYGPY